MEGDDEDMEWEDADGGSGVIGGASTSAELPSGAGALERLTFQISRIVVDLEDGHVFHVTSDALFVWHSSDAVRQPVCLLGLLRSVMQQSVCNSFAADVAQ